MRLRREIRNSSPSTSLGGKAPVGLLMLGTSVLGRMDFGGTGLLRGCAKQLAVAIENFRLLEQVLRSQRQWVNTLTRSMTSFSPMTPTTAVIKPTRFCSRQLGQSSRRCDRQHVRIGSSPQFGEWTGAHTALWAATKNLPRVHDPCFGGFSVVSHVLLPSKAARRKGTFTSFATSPSRRSAEEKYRLLFEQVQEGVYVSDPSGNLIDCNDAFVHMLGYGNSGRALVLNLDSEICVDPKQRDTFAARSKLTTTSAISKSRCAEKTDLAACGRRAASPPGSRSRTIQRYQGICLDTTEKTQSRRRNAAPEPRVECLERHGRRRGPIVRSR